MYTKPFLVDLEQTLSQQDNVKAFLKARDDGPIPELTLYRLLGIVELGIRQKLQQSGDELLSLWLGYDVFKPIAAGETTTAEETGESSGQETGEDREYLRSYWVGWGWQPHYEVLLGGAEPAEGTDVLTPVERERPTDSSDDPSLPSEDAATQPGSDEQPTVDPDDSDDLLGSPKLLASLKEILQSQMPPVYGQAGISIEPFLFGHTDRDRDAISSPIEDRVEEEAPALSAEDRAGAISGDSGREVREMPPASLPPTFRVMPTPSMPRTFSSLRRIRWWWGRGRCGSCGRGRRRLASGRCKRC